jgi:hypothetical protein
MELNKLETDGNWQYQHINENNVRLMIILELNENNLGNKREWRRVLGNKRE